MVKSNKVAPAASVAPAAPAAFAKAKAVAFGNVSTMLTLVDLTGVVQVPTIRDLLLARLLPTTGWQRQSGSSGAGSSINLTELGLNLLVSAPAVAPAPATPAAVADIRLLNVGWELTVRKGPYPDLLCERFMLSISEGMAIDTAVQQLMLGYIDRAIRWRNNR